MTTLPPSPPDGRGQARNNTNALAAATHHLVRDEAERRTAAFGVLDSTYKHDWTIGNRMISDLLHDGLSHNQIHHLLRVGATRIRHIAAEMASSTQPSAPSNNEESANTVVDEDSGSSGSDPNYIPTRKAKRTAPRPIAATITDLRDQVRELETQLTATKHKVKSTQTNSTTSPVSWKDVARVMQALSRDIADHQRR
ncbi:hypothetical protein DYB34_013365 [Aphanomyces astaci]|uniref:Uncharacterized protein n=1 Tax=Aphanomyces astaci TaxID=112090 RepID=A0A418C9A9_APHAT|nr:hypothetical protein DYB34_013365 [Aphanomyces astaci]